MILLLTVSHGCTHDTNIDVNYLGNRISVLKTFPKETRHIHEHILNEDWLDCEPQCTTQSARSKIG